MQLFRRKHPDIHQHQLRPSLNAFDLTLMGIGVIIGAGVFVLTGVAAATKAGPAITLSYIIAGLASLFAALSYAELATSIGGCGSAYNYTYAGFGELIAWIIGWNLIFEYTLAVSTVAIGWSGYVENAFEALHVHLPIALTHNPFEGGIINLPAVLIIFVLGLLLCVGVRQSARFNAMMVSVKLLTITLFTVVAIKYTNPSNWKNFFPFGWSGVMSGAALVFYAYIGFDALSTAAEETKNPQRNIPIGILCSLIFCVTIYVLVSGLLSSIVPYTTLNVKSPVADALLNLGHSTIAGLIAAGAIAGLTTGMLVMYYGVTRITLAIARDGLLPKPLARVNPITHTPINNILIYGLIMGAIAGFVPLGAAAELINIGTLSAFTLVSAGVILLRYLHPELARPFRLPWNPLIPVLGIIFCFTLMLNLPTITWIRFIIWMIIGLFIYFFWSYKHSFLNKSST
ncbi:MAG: amino acid permease [Gammaproteobacteria bacterium]|nr:amino acid permease [Gammaproteobacteria bacterium]